MKSWLALALLLITLVRNKQVYTADIEDIEQLEQVDQLQYIPDEIVGEYFQNNDFQTDFEDDDERQQRAKNQIYDPNISEEQENQQNLIKQQENSNIIAQIKTKFQEFQQRFGKSYSKQQEPYRFGVFRVNMKIIDDHNVKSTKYAMGINHFGDYTNKQFKSNFLLNEDTQQVVKKQMTAPLPPPPPSTSSQLQTSSIADYGLDTIIRKPVDWRNNVTFGPIKDQKKCAACYAFAIIGAIQLNYALSRKTKAPILSEQQIIDCCASSGYRCSGCKSGHLGSTIQYLSASGIATSFEYPYTAVVQKCKSRFRKRSFLKIGKSFYQLFGVTNTIYYLVNKGPLAVAIDSTTWKFYKQGVFNSCPKDNFKFQHSVVLIGIQGNGTWLIRNSWGTNWGEAGYMRLAPGNSCGLTNFVFFPLVN